MIDMKVLGLTLDGINKAPILVLKAVRGEDILPLWIGGVEAMSISLALTNAKAERPLTHDLLVGLLHSLGVSLAGVSIVDVRDGIFYAILDLVRGSEMLQIDCRPSDGIALALRLQAPIRAAASVLAQAPRERYQAAMAGKTMASDETGELVRRSLKQVEEMLAASGAPPVQEKIREKTGEQAANTVITGGLAGSARSEPAAPDDDPFAKLLRDLEPASKNRM
jgi:bifunctional DNase/RNase